MLKQIRRIAVAVALMAAFALPASAQFHFGIKAGVNVSSLKFDEDVFSSENRAGFTGGIMAEFMIPLTNVGLDASVMYVHRSNEYMKRISDPAQAGTQTVSNGRDYIEIPINFKWKIGIPVVGKFLAPYLYTGPSFAFLTGRTAIEDGLKNKKFDAAWNFGVGLEVLGKVQVGASYGLGMTKAMETLTKVEGVDINGKNNYWTVTAAYLF